MKGLKQYLKKHGAHFTKDIVMDIIPIRWSYEKIEGSIGNEVWFNCWSATEGDILYLVNSVYESSCCTGFHKCVKHALGTVGNYNHKDLFYIWVKDNGVKDLTPYI